MNARSNKKKKSGAYLRRSRLHQGMSPPVLFLIETRKPDADTPAALFWEMYQFPFASMQPPEPRRAPLPHPTKDAR